MSLTLDDICDDADEVMATIGNKPERLNELNDYDLTTVAVKVKTLRPILEGELVERAGGVEKANAILQRLMGFKQERLVKIVRDGVAAIQRGHVLTLYQLAGLTIDAQVGVGAVMLEQERRAAVRGGAMN